MFHRCIQWLTIVCFTAVLRGQDCVWAADENVVTQTRDPQSLVGALFDDRIVATNTTAVRHRIAELPPAERFDALMSWVLPSQTHTTIRMNGEFSQTDPAPNLQGGVAGDDVRGGVLVSPVFDLLDVAKQTDRLTEVLSAVGALPRSVDEQQQRARSALLVLIHLEMGQHENAATEADRLLKDVKKSVPAGLADMWPETLVVPVERPRLGVSPTTVILPWGLPPLAYSWRWRLPPRSTSMRRRSESALTTDTPTPWRPPETL